MGEVREHEAPKIVCPTCGVTISADITLWVLNGKWYCSERCVRDGLKKH